MKFCTNCGSQIEENAQFCPVCGAKQAGATVAPVEKQQANNMGTPIGLATKKATFTKPKSVIAIIIGVLVIIGISFVFIKAKVVVSQDRLAANITKAVQDKDGKLFLKQFDSETQDLKFADVGAQSVVTDMHNKASIPSAEIGKEVAAGKVVPGTKKYKFYVESKRVLGMQSYYLVARKTSAIINSGYGNENLKFTLTNGGKKQSFDPADFKSGIFPGTYYFTMKGQVNDITVDRKAWIRVDGRESSYEYDL